MNEPTPEAVEVVARALCANRCDSRFSVAPWRAHTIEASRVVAAIRDALHRDGSDAIREALGLKETA